MPRTISSSPAPPASTTPALRRTSSSSGVRSTASAPRSTTAASSSRGRPVDVRLRLLGHLADNREHRPFDRLRHCAVRGVAGPAERSRQRRRVELLGLGDDLGEAAQDLREDDARVAAGAHQRCARQFVRERREIVRCRRVQLFDRGSDGEREIRARVAVGDRVDVEVVDAPAVALEREQRAARKLARSFDVGHAVN